MRNEESIEVGVLLRYREGQFTPADAQAATGLSLVLQRDWRALGLFPPVGSGHARFTPFELAVMKVMVKLRKRGMKPAACRALAEQAAPSLLYFALRDCKGALAWEPADGRGERYYHQLVKDTDEQFVETMLGIENRAWYRILLLPDEGEGEPEFLDALQNISLEDPMEGAAYISLSATAAKLVAALPRPLFTLVAPPSFE